MIFTYRIEINTMYRLSINDTDLFFIFFFFFILIIFQQESNMGLNATMATNLGHTCMSALK